jgi:predicted tellurium resistance membrane protein TerC
MTNTISRVKEILKQLLPTQRRLVLEALVFLVFVTAVELAIAHRNGGDHLTYFAESAASFFLIVVLLLSWSTVRFERRQEPEKSHER